ncbi:SDR family oxidoreductase [Antarcticibacterium sp. 1MA-6-2]|uniref:SDR family NAD(P)-dependent oxidoreductase n=1 Tax=Antarcticibacterium sp. 1MA-6-2 TaxID=2908210 RepID=UPI001F1684A2|nr:SDR family oxidoreductase [Antarcticibacterium sp. 1MA-6-2]UJH92824.1 SDR family oxidoreductase [Antarcticibacterium sp. 1MA-6-2]
MKRLEGKTAIVTGGGTGIGEAICKKFALEGANVLVVGMPQDPVEKVVSEISSNNGQAISFKGDISEIETAKKAIKAATDKWGKIDILINNAGVYPEVNTVDEYSVEAFENMLKNNVRTTFLMTKLAIPELKKTKGCIVSAGSESAIVGIPEVAAYGGTKGFVHSFMKGVAAEQAENGIRVNVVAPGPIDTSWTHKETSGLDKESEKTMVNATLMGRRGKTEEVANVYLFLASDEATYVTGSVYQVDGGITIAKGPMGKKVEDGLHQPKETLNLKHEHDGTTKIK